MIQSKFNTENANANYSRLDLKTTMPLFYRLKTQRNKIRTHLFESNGQVIDQQTDSIKDMVLCDIENSLKDGSLSFDLLSLKDLIAIGLIQEQAKIMKQKTLGVT
ncbi:hypothetical protein KP509_03G033800 [Ceratopteris richardii]|uniref:Uncharacterized protein n=1 Tax=Ceratopteris richardii TaxID=49495 RepID=A0A8T2V1N2_CERRI|nr:hypothetical protein KP509_03G033800 [Ceratopteris richardii]